jgi:hypothetical protein
MDNNIEEIIPSNKLDEIPKSNIILDGSLLIYSCPHCGLLITTEISELACRIFRHGFCIKTNVQINPHMPKFHCDILVNQPNIIGCCKPYRINVENNVYNVEPCDYI